MLCPYLKNVVLKVVIVYMLGIDMAKVSLAVSQKASVWT